MELARRHDIKVNERHMTPDELAKTQEVFLTGTAAEVTPVGQIDDYKFTVGPVTKLLMQAYHDLVRQQP